MNIRIRKIKVASRPSPLAKVQVEEVHALLKDRGFDAAFDRKTYATGGDRDKKTPLTRTDADDFFTDTLDEALLNREIDVAVHSAKDLPKTLRKGISIFALTAPLDDTDCFAGQCRFADLKPGAKVGTSSQARQDALKALNPKLKPVEIRGTIEERLQLVDKGVCDGIIVATVALKRLGLDKHIKDIMPWPAVPLQGQLAVVGRTEDMVLKSLFAAIDARKSYGRVYLVGAGPGDPDLVTVKAIKALKQADCVFYDYLAPKELLDYAPDSEKIYVGKRKGAHTVSQEELSRQLIQKVREGRTVVRLKGGDPLIFGRGAEEIEYLRSHHMNVHVIPGVSSATAIPSNLGVPLTARGMSSSVAFISGHARGEKGKKPRLVEIPDVDTIVFLMGLTKLDIILESLERAGWSKETPAMVVARGTCEDEQVIVGNLKNITRRVLDAKPELPALIIVGPTVGFWDPANYRSGRILYTGTDPEKFKPLGRLVHLPMIRIEQAKLKAQQIKDILKRMYQFHMIIFTSRFAVKYFFETLGQKKFDLKELKEKDFITIGRSTAEVLRSYGFEPALVARVETSDGLLRDMTAKFDVKNKKILFPRSSLPNPTIKNELTRRGAGVEELAIYQNVKLPKRELPEGIDRVIFTSPSTVRNFLKDYQTIPRDWKIISKGPVTREILKEAGYESEVLVHD